MFVVDALALRLVVVAVIMVAILATCELYKIVECETMFECLLLRHFLIELSTNKSGDSGFVGDDCKTN